MTNTKRIEKLEAEVKTLQDLVNLLIGERRRALEARDASVRRAIGIPQ